MAQRSAALQRVAIVGASSILAKELKQVLEDRNFPSSDIVLLDEGDVVGTLTDAAGEPTFIQEIDADSFEGARFAFLAGGETSASRHWKAAADAGATPIDLSGGVGPRAGASIWIPSLDLVLPPPVSADGHASKKSVYHSPNTAVIIATTLAAGLSEFSPSRVAILFFPPVSEAGQPGVNELETQTTELLSFRPIEKKVFDAQVAFNLVAGYGEERKPSLAEMRAKIAGDVSHYLAKRMPAPAIQLVQAPIFYGYAFAAYVDFAKAIDAEKLAAAMSNVGVKVAAKDELPPDNVSAAGQEEIQIAAIEQPEAGESGIWMWGVTDNLRLAATNAVRIAEELLAVPA
jgi:aspartate-semialdehyde dehydrogenase